MLQKLFMFNKIMCKDPATARINAYSQADRLRLNDLEEMHSSYIQNAFLIYSNQSLSRPIYRFSLLWC